MFYQFPNFFHPFQGSQGGFGGMPGGGPGFGGPGFGGPGFGLHDTDLIGTAGIITDRMQKLIDLGFTQIVLFTHDRASDQTLELLAGEVIPGLSG